MFGAFALVVLLAAPVGALGAQEDADAWPTRIVVEPGSPAYGQIKQELDALAGSLRDGWLVAPLTEKERQRVLEIPGVLSAEPLREDETGEIHPVLADPDATYRGPDAAMDDGGLSRKSAAASSGAATTMTISGYACYNTVEATYALGESIARQFPNLARWYDVGDSWFKATGSSGYEVRVSGTETIDFPGGHDLYVLVLTNSATGGAKPKLFVQGSIHAREYSAAATVARFAQQLVTHYGSDADATWLLDHHEVHLLLHGNPDARKLAEVGYPTWRKNANSNDHAPARDWWCSGVDINRNYAHGWGGTGSGSGTCSQTYRGKGAASEPETRASANYMERIFSPATRGSDGAVPDDAPGVFLDVHNFSEIYVASSPNARDQERMLEFVGKLGVSTGYPEAHPYSAAGTADEFAQHRLGLMAVTPELGTSFHQSCSTYESTVAPDNIESFHYAARVAGAPWKLPAGPDVAAGSLALSGSAEWPGRVAAGTSVTLSASLSDLLTSNVSPYPTEARRTDAELNAAEYTIDTPPWASGATAHAMTGDGAANFTATLNTTGLAAGRHTVYVRGRGSDGTWGPVSALFLGIGSAGGGTDTAAPVLSSGEVDGAVARLTFSESLDNLVVEPAQFSVTGAGKVVAAAANDNVVTLALRSPLAAGAAAELAYTPGATPLADFAGNQVAALSGSALSNVTPLAAGLKLLSQEVEDTTLTLVFAATLDTSSWPAASEFTVRVAGTAAAVTQVSLAGATVTLTLAQSVAAADAVTLDYTGTSIRDTSGNLAAAALGIEVPYAAQWNATSGADTIIGSANDDTIDGLDGNDTISGLGGDDILDGGGGNDTLDGGDGDDVLSGGSGDDTLTGGAGADTFVYGAQQGDDTITDFEDGVDRIDVRGARFGFHDLYFTADGSDTLVQDQFGRGFSLRLTGVAPSALTAADFLHDPEVAIADADAVTEGEPAAFEVTVTGVRTGDVTVTWQTVTDTAGNGDYTGGTGLLRFPANVATRTVAIATLTDLELEGRETFQVWLGHPHDGARIARRIGTGTINDPTPADLIQGTNGNDTLTGTPGDDIIDGGDGDDTITGGDGDDTLFGGDGVDTIDGEDGADTLFGGDGNDTLNGGNGDDRIVGGKGGDTLTGGDGWDIFAFPEYYSGADTITDWNNHRDKFDLRGSGVVRSWLTIQANGDDAWVWWSGGYGGDVHGNGTRPDIVLKGAASLPINYTHDWPRGHFRVDPLISIRSGGQVPEGAAASFRVEIIGPRYGVITVQWKTVKDHLTSALPDVDYEAASGVLTFPEGVTTQYIRVTTFRDNITEADENFAVELDNASGASSGEYRNTAVIVEDATGGVPTSGSDTLTGTDFDDVIDGLGGNDTISGGKGNDRLDGSTGDDTLNGDAGSDRLDGGADNDILTGGADNDILTGGAGNDVLTGGGGSDIFVFTFAHGTDTVTDFDDGTDLLNFRGSGLRYTDLTIAQDGADTVVSHTDESNIRHSITLTGIAATAIGPADFLLDPELSVADAAQVQEGGKTEFKVSLTGNREGMVSVQWSTSDGTANAGSDYASGDGTLMFDQGVNSQMIEVETLDDSDQEASETFTVALKAPTGAVIADGDAIGTIADGGGTSATAGDDTITGTDAGENLDGLAGNDTIDGAGGDDTINGGDGDDTLAGGTGDDTISGDAGDDTLTGGADADTFVYANAAFGEDTITDFEDGTDRLDIRGSGLAYADLSIAQANNDTVISHTDDGNVTHSITLTGVAAGNIDRADFLLDPEIAIADASPVAEGATAEFTVSVTGTRAGTVTVQWTTADATAASGSDYTAVNGTLTFPAGTNSGTISVVTLADSDDEGNETFTVTLSNATGATLGDATGEATISDDDQEGIDYSKYSDLIDDVRGYAAETNHGQPHVDRWMRVLAALGEDNGYTAMTAAEAQTMADTFTASRWDPVVEALTEIETALAAQALPVASIDDVSVSEGGQAQFTVSLDKTWTDDVTLVWDTADGTAVSGSDYTGQAAQPLTVTAGAQSQTFAVQTTSDAIDEADETFTVTLSNASNATLGDATGVATITDDDAAPVLSIDDITVAEGAAGQFTITLDAVSGRDVTVSWATADGTATSGSDYTAQTSQSATVAAGAQSATATVQTLDDSDDEGDETFTVTLSNAANATLGDATGEATISDDDQEGIDYSKYSDLIDDVRGYAAETNHGQPHVDRWMRVLAALGEDNGYTAMTAAEAQTMADTFTASRWDPVVEALTEIETALAAQALPVASIDDVSVSEGGQAQFTVSLDKTWTDDVTLVWDTADGTAVSGSDYTGQAAQPLTVTAGAQSQTFAVQTTSDAIDEADETFTVTLSNASNATLGDATGVATITDDDAAPVLSIDDITVAEGAAGQFTITLDAVSGRDVTVSWATADGTATSGSDYTAQTSQSATVAAGAQSATATVQTLDDSDDEGDETFTVTLSNAANATLGDATGEATISDDDQEGIDYSKYSDLIDDVRGYAAETNHGQPHVDRWMRVLAALGEDNGYTAMTAAEAQTMADTYTASRWDPVVEALTEIEATGVVPGPDPEISISGDGGVTEGGDATFTVTANPAPAASLQVDVAISQTGDFGVTTGSRTVTVPTGGSATLTVTTGDDSADEADGSVTATLNPGQGYTVSTSNGAATVAVADDDPTPATPVVSIAGGNGVTEGGDATFTVTANPAPGSPLSVSVSVTQTGDFGVTTGSRTVTVLTGGSATLTVTTGDDSTDEADGSVTATVNPGQGYTVSTSNGAATVAVVDDDPTPPATPEVSIAGGNGVTEGGDATFTVTANPAPAASLQVDVAISQTGDYGVTPGTRTVTVPTGGSATLTVTTGDDSTDEADGSVTATVNPGQGYTVSTSNGAATVAIADDDPQAGPPTLSSSNASAREDAGALEFVVELSAPSSRKVTVDYQTSGVGTADRYVDYQPVRGTLAFAPGETRHAIQVELLDDQDVEGDETMEMMLLAAKGATLGSYLIRLKGTIVDDD